MKSHLPVLLAALLVTACGSDNVSDAPQSPQSRIEHAGTLEVAVSEARAVYVPSRGVVLTGGDYRVGGTDVIQFFDASTGSARVLGHMLDARFVHSATLTTTGRLIVAGGFNRTGRFLDSVEQLDAATGAATPLHPLCEERDNQHAVALPDGRVLFIGGDSDGAGYIAGLEIYDPSGASSDCGLRLAQGRVHEAVIDAGSGVVYVFGGLAADEDGNLSYLRSIERIDTANRRVEAAGSMQIGRKQFEATRLRDGRILLTGGYSDGEPVVGAEVFDPATGVSTRVGAMHEARAGHSATLLDDGKVLVAGGIGPDGALKSTEIFDPATGVFRSGPEMTAARYLHAAQRLPDGSVVLLGGYQGNGDYTAVIDRFEPDPR